MLAQGTGIKGCGKQHDYHDLLLKDKLMVAPLSYKNGVHTAQAEGKFL